MSDKPMLMTVWRIYVDKDDLIVGILDEFLGNGYYIYPTKKTQWAESAGFVIEYQEAIYNNLLEIGTLRSLFPRR